MSPWSVLGWVLVALVVLVVLGIIAGFVKGYRQAYARARLRRRAEAGKVTCQALVKGAPNPKNRLYCTNTATRRTSAGYACEEHLNKVQQYSLSFAMPLEWAEKDIEARRQQRGY